MKNEVENLFRQQLIDWETARKNYKSLHNVETKTFDVNGCEFEVQFNPARIVSSGAKVDAKSIRERKCFLCPENRPKEQEGIPFGENYTILVNPFPIFPKHFTIPENSHVPQSIYPRFGDMLDLAELMDKYIVFYNGPKCGASAPDHVHFQAGSKGFLPLERNWEKHVSEKINNHLFVIDYGFLSLMIQTENKETSISLFDKIYKSLTVKPDESEPMMNILSWKENRNFHTIIIPRKKHRPACYFAEGDENILVSPAAVDLGGVFITPLEKDFNKITQTDIAIILNEVCFNIKDNRQMIVKIQNLLNL